MVQALVYRAVRRPSTDAWHTRRVCTTLPTIIVETLDAIARDTGRSRSAVITDALLAHPDIAAALTARGVLVSSDVPPVDSDDAPPNHVADLSDATLTGWEAWDADQAGANPTDAVMTDPAQGVDDGR